MAQFDIHGVNEFMAQLDKLGNFDEVAPKMLEGAVPVLEKEVVKQVSAHWVTGDMANSIKRTGVLKTKSGSYYISVRPTGKDRKGVRNMEKAVWLEYGVRGRPAVPILTTAVLNATPEVQQKMKEVFDREVNG
ncbi:MAG: HK97 gp10 family phage protein [Lachnospiraceae bacterium]|nr:HK97 gp10 family phage protein [Lachnospiraceae bacterium]